MADFRRHLNMMAQDSEFVADSQREQCDAYVAEPPYDNQFMVLSRLIFYDYM